MLLVQGSEQVIYRVKYSNRIDHCLLAHSLLSQSILKGYTTVSWSALFRPLAICAQLFATLELFTAHSYSLAFVDNSITCEEDVSSRLRRRHLRSGS